MHGYSFITSNNFFINVPGSSQQKCWLDPGNPVGVGSTTRELVREKPLPVPKRQKLTAICDATTSGAKFDAKVTHVANMNRETMLESLEFIEPLAFGGTSLLALVEKGKREISKDKLLQLMTFSTGSEPHYEIQGEELEINVFNINSKEKSDIRGNRGQRLALAHLPLYGTMNHICHMGL